MTHRLLFLRSLLFNVCFISWLLISSILCIPYFLLPPKIAAKSGPVWGRVVLWLARVILNLRYEIRGAENITYGPIIYASKHQSAWDTAIFFMLFQWPAYILKRELLFIPFWGWYLWRIQMIAIDRSGGGSSLKSMVRQAKATLFQRRPIIIFPEGTRTMPGAAPHYHPGIAALYSQLHVPVIPVALNSGLYWSKNAYIKYPGTIIIEFLPAIEPGLDRQEFMERLQNAIEPASQKLLQR